jgi:glutamate carboxypeptidase
VAVSRVESEVLGWLEGQYPAMIELLERLVNTDSGSYDQEGVARVQEYLRRHLEERGIATRTIPSAEVDGHRSADCLAAEVRAGSNAGHVLLLGHSDTVFPKGEAAARPFRVEGGRGYGPGVGDMKSGLVMNTFVLEAIGRFAGPGRPVRALYTVDEEIASPASRGVIEAEATGARAVFNAEPGRASGNVVAGRKGAMFLTIEATGVAAHSGGAHQHGRSAIDALCRKVLELHALTDYDSGTTFNVGLIEGGQSVNTVAPWARCRLDVRFKTMAAMAEAERAIAAIVERTHVEGTSARITGRGTFLPLEETPEGDALFALYRDAAAGIGLGLDREYTGGSADSGFTAAVGTPTLCGTGPVGLNSHQPEEVCQLDTLLPRAKALALAILRLDG